MIAEGLELLRYEGAKIVEAHAITAGECAAVFISYDGRRIEYAPTSPARKKFIDAIVVASQKTGPFCGLGVYQVTISGAFTFTKK